MGLIYDGLMYERIYEILKTGLNPSVTRWHKTSVTG